MIGSNVSIFRKGLVLVGLPIGLQLVVVICLVRLQYSADEADKWAVHTKEVIARAEESYRLVMETIAQARGAIIANDADYTTTSANIADRVMPAIERLRTSVNDNPEQVQRVDQFREIAASILQRTREERTKVRAGDVEGAADMVKGMNAQHNLEKLHGVLTTILDVEQRLDITRIERVNEIRRQGYWFMGATVIITLAVAALVLWIFVRNVAQRLATLAVNAGNLGARRPLMAQIDGTDEIGVVDTAFHTAARQLAEADIADTRHRAELERRAAELADINAQLARSNGDLRFKTQEIETFVYSVSHDLRSPLVNLQGFSKELAQSCEELRRDASNGSVPDATKQHMLNVIDSDILESVHFIQTAVTRSSNIIDALLRLSRAGRLDYKHLPVTVTPIVQRVVDAMQSVIREKGAELVIGDLPDCEADPTAVEQIFGNLIGNAVNYLSPSRPGRIVISAEHRKGDSLSGGKPLVQYAVKDNGLGIPAAYLPKMFVAFQRLHGQVAPGEGIGLAMVRRMVERLGGQIWVESQENVGSTFFFTLPAVTSDNHVDIGAAAGKTYSGHVIAKD